MRGYAGTRACVSCASIRICGRRLPNAKLRCWSDHRKGRFTQKFPKEKEQVRPTAESGKARHFLSRDEARSSRRRTLHDREATGTLALSCRNRSCTASVAASDGGGGRPIS